MSSQLRSLCRSFAHFGYLLTRGRIFSMAAHSADTLQASVGMVRLRLPDRFLPCGLGLYCQRSNPSPHRVAIGSRVSGQAGTEQGYPRILKFDDSDASNIDGCGHTVLAFDVGNGKSQRKERMLGTVRSREVQRGNACTILFAHIRAE